MSGLFTWRFLFCSVPLAFLCFDVPVLFNIIFCMTKPLLVLVYPRVLLANMVAFRDMFSFFIVNRGLSKALTNRAGGIILFTRVFLQELPSPLHTPHRSNLSLDSSSKSQPTLWTKSNEMNGHQRSHSTTQLILSSHCRLSSIDSKSHRQKEKSDRYFSTETSVGK